MVIVIESYARFGRKLYRNTFPIDYSHEIAISATDWELTLAVLLLDLGNSIRIR